MGKKDRCSLAYFTQGTSGKVILSMLGRLEFLLTYEACLKHRLKLVGSLIVYFLPAYCSLYSTEAFSILQVPISIVYQTTAGVWEC